MIQITIKYADQKNDYLVDPRQQILKVLREIYGDDLKTNKIRLALDKRTIDVENSFEEMNIKNNEIITVL